ncbi:MAG: DUF4124 domain-containing protein [Azoarcus sp.]|jgi:hypothetical protein|nr:DUF4124 domain-containing protein [Azoarcus sp.]
MKHHVRFAIFALALASSLPASAEIYKWTDKDGQTHFSDIPPSQAEAETLNLPAPPRSRSANTQEDAAQENAAEENKDSSESVASESATPKSAGPASAIPAAAPAKSLAERELEFRQRRAAAAESRNKAEADAAASERRAQDCQRVRAQHKALASGQRMARTTEDGGRVFISDDEREAETARAQELIDRLCTGQ